MSVLIVAPDESDRLSLVDALRSLDAVDVVGQVSSFQQATEALGSSLPDVLITELQLGAYNGLHLVLRAKAMRPGMKAFVLVRSADPVLEQEAAQLDAEFLVQGSDEAWLASIVAALGAIPPGRQNLAMRPIDDA